MPSSPSPNSPASRSGIAPRDGDRRQWAVRLLCVSLGVGIGFSYWVFAPRTFQVKALVGVAETNDEETIPDNLRLRQTVQRLTSREVRVRAEHALHGGNEAGGPAEEPQLPLTVSILDQSRLAVEVMARSERAAEAMPELLVRAYQSSRQPPAPASPADAPASKLPGSIAEPAASPRDAPTAGATVPAPLGEAARQTPEMERWNRLRRTMEKTDSTTLEKLAILAAAETASRSETESEKAAPPAWNQGGPNSWEALYEQRRELEAALKEANSSRDLKTFTELRNQLSSLDARVAARLQAGLEWLESQAAKAKALPQATPANGTAAAGNPSAALPPSLFYLGLLQSRELPLSPRRFDVFCVSSVAGLLLALILPRLISRIRKTQANLALLPRRLRLRNFGRVPALCSEGRVPRLIDLGARNLPARAVQDLYGQLEDAEIDHRPWKTLLLCAALPSLEKSALAANLARAFADAGFRTLLMDTDVEHGRCHLFFGFRPYPGLTALLEGDATIDVAVRQSPEPELSLLPAGKYADPQVLNLSRWSSLLAPFSTYFDRIIIAAPCAGPALDRLGSLKYADAALLLVDERRDDIPAARRALRRLRRAGARLAGFAVFNGELPAREDHPTRTTSPAPAPFGREAAPNRPLVHLHG